MSARENPKSVIENIKFNNWQVPHCMYSYRCWEYFSITYTQILSSVINMLVHTSAVYTSFVGFALRTKCPGKLISSSPCKTVVFQIFHGQLVRLLFSWYCNLQIALLQLFSTASALIGRKGQHSVLWFSGLHFLGKTGHGYEEALEPPPVLECQAHATLTSPWMPP